MNLPKDGFAMAPFVRHPAQVKQKTKYSPGKRKRNAAIYFPNRI